MASNTTNHISSYNENDEQDISHVSGCSAGDMKTDIDKDTPISKLDNVAINNDRVLPPEIYAGVMECKFLVCNYIV